MRSMGRKAIRKSTDLSPLLRPKKSRCMSHSPLGKLNRTNTGSMSSSYKIQIESIVQTVENCMIRLEKTLESIRTGMNNM